MPRGFKLDIILTQATRDSSGLLNDPRSFVSLPKVTPHTNGVALPHLILYGIDKGVIRHMLFEESRRANGDARCRKCGCRVSENQYGTLPDGEWDHIENSPGLRCDCCVNGQILCPTCHRPKHPQTQFTGNAE